MESVRQAESEVDRWNNDIRTVVAHSNCNDDFIWKYS